ncbi:hypothetical protein AG1IA_09913 [Rhizoctonia solani AG-1 IA]|uniref:Uncharacterized protein n=1 Tax=Thanatephorus cucumeris (strain AG1-IA) TaxID=983506 RepID=L8WH49_THACA|nr:hypothetical protein AG1IA_09913 [Rhizoctonia solani AG-1 IA]
MATEWTLLVRSFVRLNTVSPLDVSYTSMLPSLCSASRVPSLERPMDLIHRDEAFHVAISASRLRAIAVPFGSITPIVLGMYAAETGLEGGQKGSIDT